MSGPRKNRIPRSECEQSRGSNNTKSGYFRRGIFRLRRSRDCQPIENSLPWVVSGSSQQAFLLNSCRR